MNLQSNYEQTEIGMIPKKWEVRKLGSIAKFQYGLGESAESAGEYVYVRITDINSDGFLDNSNLAYISEKKVTDDYILKKGDVLVARTGATYGKTYYFREKFKASYGGFLIRLLLDNQAIDNSFFFQFSRGSLYWNQASNLVTGGAQPQFNANVISEILLPLPPLPEQRAIAKILSDLDAKIELNRKMNTTLEAIAQAIFKHWFIDFEFPNEEGKSYKSSGGDMVYNQEFGKEIPKEWGVGILGDICTNPRRSIKRELMKPRSLYIGLEHMPRRSIALTDWEFADKIESNKYQFNKGDILFGKLRPYFHKVGVAPVSGVCSTDILVLVPKLTNWKGTVLSIVSSSDFVNFANASSTGTRMPRTNWDIMATYKIVIPSETVCISFNDIITNIVEKILSNILLSHKLKYIRDSLLPKLMTGKIKVPVKGDK